MGQGTLFFLTIFAKFTIQLILIIFSITIANSVHIDNQTDHLALLDFKSKITNDPQNVFNSWNVSNHFCNWEGVTCDLKHQRVTLLTLPSKGFIGYLSPNIGNLSFLQQIILTNNFFKGPIPPQFGQLSRLQVLNLSNNFLEGEIPKNLSYCRSLSVLAVAKNKLTGAIPTSFVLLSKLTLLILQFNFLMGGLQPFIGNLTSLVSFSIAYNNLGGTIPVEIVNLKSLQRIGLTGNNLSGEVPQSLYNLSSLTVLSLSQNNLQGGIPTNIGITLPSLRWFQIWGNKFTKSIPISLSNASGLQLIEMHRNTFTGKVAIDFGKMARLNRLNMAYNMLGTGDPDELDFITSMVNCTNLEMLGFNHNQLDGVLPNSLGKLSTKLTELSIGDNRFHGDLPYGIGNLINLTMLSMQNGKFSGKIPDDLGNLRNLKKLYLGSNNFFGEIPSSLGDLQSLLELHLDDNKLQRSIPASLGNCQKLLLLNLSQNDLIGFIPKQLFTISSLSMSLNLARNNLSGVLPSEIHNLVHLTELDVSHNKLSGNIPISLSGCNSLENLRINDNLFEGIIPSSLSAMRGLRNIDFSQNHLSGKVPQFLETFSLTHINLSFNSLEGEVPMRGSFSNISAISVEGNNKLCGGNPKLQLPKCAIELPKRSKILDLAKMIFPILTVACTIFGTIGIVYRLRGKRKVQTSRSIVPENLVWRVSYEKLYNATNQFSSRNFVGEGRYGTVYKGILDEDGSIIAIKVFKLQQQGAPKSFMIECEAWRYIRHRNLVKIITCCSSTDFQGNEFKALIYEFMPNGSLETWLHFDQFKNQVATRLNGLNFRQRVSVAIDVVTALDYLHHQCHQPIVHCDLKPSNILLDNDMIAHVGDFGLAKFLPPLRYSGNSSLIGVRGSIGYIAPEYGLGGEVSTKGDVYSYGILLLEMMTGKKPTDEMFTEGLNLHKLARMAMATHSILEIVDPILIDNEATFMFDYPSEAKYSMLNCLVSIIKIGIACSMESPEERLDISQVICQLRLINDTLSLYKASSDGSESIDL